MGTTKEKTKDQVIQENIEKSFLYQHNKEWFGKFARKAERTKELLSFTPSKEGKLLLFRRRA